MKSADEGLAKVILGRWRSAHQEEVCDWQFAAENQFVCVVNTRSGSSETHGYWDVRNNSLRIGISAGENDASEIIEHSQERFSTRLPNNGVVEFERVTEPAIS